MQEDRKLKASLGYIKPPLREWGGREEKKGRKKIMTDNNNEGWAQTVEC